MCLTTLAIIFFRQIRIPFLNIQEHITIILLNATINLYPELIWQPSMFMVAFSSYCGHIHFLESRINR
jgi:hypothetical protein